MRARIQTQQALHHATGGYVLRLRRSVVSATDLPFSSTLPFSFPDLANDWPEPHLGNPLTACFFRACSVDARKAPRSETALCAERNASFPEGPPHAWKVAGDKNHVSLQRGGPGGEDPPFFRLHYLPTKSPGPAFWKRLKAETQPAQRATGRNVFGPWPCHRNCMKRVLVCRLYLSFSRPPILRWEFEAWAPAI